MEVKTQRIIGISLVVFCAIVITVSLCFGDRLPKSPPPQGITHGYLFAFDVNCVDESGDLIKTVKMEGNGTLWSFEPPEIEGYTTERMSITRDDITNWSYPASNYIRKAGGSIVVQYKADTQN